MTTLVAKNQFGELLHHAGLDGPSLLAPSFILVDLVSGEEHVRSHTDTPFYPACMIKVPLALVYFHFIAEGRLQLDDLIEVTQGDMTDTAPPAPVSAGKSYKVYDLLCYTLRLSDNIATNALIGHLDRHEANRVLHGYGLTQTYIRRKLSGGLPLVNDPGALGRNAHPPCDSARLFEMIWKNEVPYAKEIFEAMYWDEPRMVVEAGLQEGDSISLKTGYTDAVMHQSAILQIAGSRPLLFVLYTNAGYTDEARFKIVNLVRELRKLVTLSPA